jgi:hypothetical protein
MKHPPLRKCRCGKLACPSLEAAREIRAKIWAANGGQGVVRFYRCGDGCWHWTRMTQAIN